MRRRVRPAPRRSPRTQRRRPMRQARRCRRASRARVTVSGTWLRNRRSARSCDPRDGSAECLEIAGSKLIAGGGNQHRGSPRRTGRSDRRGRHLAAQERRAVDRRRPVRWRSRRRASIVAPRHDAPAIQDPPQASRRTVVVVARLAGLARRDPADADRKHQLRRQGDRALQSRRQERVPARADRLRADDRGVILAAAFGADAPCAKAARGSWMPFSIVGGIRREILVGAECSRSSVVAIKSLARASASNASTISALELLRPEADGSVALEHHVGAARHLRKVAGQAAEDGKGIRAPVDGRALVVRLQRQRRLASPVDDRQATIVAWRETAQTPRSTAHNRLRPPA